MSMKTMDEVYKDAKQQVKSLAADIAKRRHQGLMWDSETGASPSFDDLFPHIVSLIQRHRDKYGTEPTHVRLSDHIEIDTPEIDKLEELGLDLVAYGMPFPSYIWVGIDPIRPITLGESLGKRSWVEDRAETPTKSEPVVEPAVTTPKGSSVIKSILPIGEQTLVIFQDGNGYLFDNIPADKVAEWKAADSWGRYWNQEIKGKYEGTKTT